MIDLYSWQTPNGFKVSITLEEMGLDYNLHPINISKDEQFGKEFLKLSPNNKIPAIVDRDNGMSLFESGAILMYLAEKTGKFLSDDPETRWKTTQWLMWQMGGIGPMLGQALHFIAFNEGKSEYAEKRYGDEAKRLYGVLDRQLEGKDFIVGDISIADFATFPWIRPSARIGIDLSDYSNIDRWFKTMAARPGVQAGLKFPV